jgi:hypothetical protein
MVNPTPTHILPVVTEDMQKLAQATVSLITRRIARENKSCGKYPGVSWADSEEKFRMRLIDEHVDGVRTLLAQRRDFDNVQVRFLRVMHFEGIVCLDLQQLANNVRIPIFLRFPKIMDSRGDEYQLLGVRSLFNKMVIV